MHEAVMNKMLANISPSLIKRRDDSDSDFEWSADAIYIIELPYITIRVLAELTDDGIDDGSNVCTFNIISWDII